MMRLDNPIINVIDRENSVRVQCEAGVPRKHEKIWWHGGGMTDEHKQALRDAAAYAEDLADKYHCRWVTNY